MPRSEEEILSGQLILHFGGERKAIPELRIRQVREWQTKLSETLKGFDMADFEGAADIGTIAMKLGDGMFDLVLAYDITGQLDRDWLEDHASPRELYSALKKMLEATFPFVQDLQGALKVVGSLSSGAPPTANSMNGHSRTGGSTLTPSSSA